MSTDSKYVVDVRTIEGVPTEVVIIGKEFEDSLDENPLHWGRNSYSSLYPGIGDYDTNRRLDGRCVYTSSELGPNFTMWAGNKDMPYAPRGIIAPWYVPVDEYRQWLKILGDDVYKISDYVRFGILPNEYRAIKAGTGNTRKSETIAAHKEGWARLGLTPSDEEIAKLTMRSAFMSGSRSSGATTPSVKIKIGMTSVILSMVIASKIEQDWFSDEVRNLYSLTASSTVDLILGMSGSNKVAPPSGLIQGCPVESGATGDQRWRAVEAKIDRAIQIIFMSNPSLSFDSHKLLVDHLLSARDHTLEMTGKRVRESRAEHDLDIELTKMLDSDAQVEVLCDVIKVLDKDHLLTGPITDVIEMIQAGTPTEWIVSGMLQRIS